MEDDEEKPLETLAVEDAKQQRAPPPLDSPPVSGETLAAPPAPAQLDGAAEEAAPEILTETNGTEGKADVSLGGSSDRIEDATSADTASIMVEEDGEGPATSAAETEVVKTELADIVTETENPIEKESVDKGENSGDIVMGLENLIEKESVDIIEPEILIASDEMKREEGEKLPVDGEMGTENLTTVTQMGLNSVVEETEIVSAKSPIKDDVAVEERGEAMEDIPVLNETELVGIESPIADEEPAKEGSVARDSLVLDESEQMGDKSPKADELAVEGEVPSEKTAMETEKEVGNSESADEVDSSKGVSVADEEKDDDSKMEIEDEVPNEDSQLENSENAEAEVVRDEDEEDEAMAGEDENLMADTEMETEVEAETPEAEKGGKRKRGKSTKIAAKASSKKVTEEDVCFICFDGGDLVLCDRRGCPKAYHPSCVNRDEAFFRAKGRWNCGWHICSLCERNAYYMCYTCTFSLCKACSKDAVILCVRGKNGFCENCMKTVTLIENTEQGNNEDQMDFDDKSSWLYLFKDYWLNLKQKLSFSSDELAQAKNPFKGSASLAAKKESPDEAVDGNNIQASSSDSEDNVEASKNKKRKPKKRLRSRAKEEVSTAANEDLPPRRKLLPSSREVPCKLDTAEWASKELLEFVMHMKNGDKSMLSQFDVQALLLEYIKRDKLRDPRRKSQIICDDRLQSLFGKPRVGHFEMLKLLESHFLVKEDTQADDNQGTVVDDESNLVDADGTIDVSLRGGKDKKRKTRRKNERGRQSNLDDYAAIDMHNITLIFLRRKLVEDLLEDIESFSDKVVGTFVRIRISASNQKQDMYRLVQVLGTGMAAEPYKVGKRTTSLMLEILNLSKKELVAIDTISNQEFTEEECKRLRQSIKCGLISRLTVGDILDKTSEIQAARVNDWLEAETVRLSHLRDRASDLGRRKELRECVEKLQLLKTPEERRRRLDEVPEVHADPNMDPNHESEEHDSEMEDTRQDSFLNSRISGFSRKGRDQISPRGGNFSTIDSWSGTRQNSGKNWEAMRNLSGKDFSNSEDPSLLGGILNENARSHMEMQQPYAEKAPSAATSETMGQNSHSYVRSESYSGAASGISQLPLPTVTPEDAVKVNESEKMWHYKDPSGKVQGPFSIVQLRKWSKNGYFPQDLRIWKNTESEDGSILLTDALAGNFQKDLPPMEKNPSNGWVSLSVDVPQFTASKGNDSLNLPSPTPNTSTPVLTKERVSEILNSPSSFSVQATNFTQTNQNGNQESISPASLPNTSRQLASGFQNDTSSFLASSGHQAPNLAQSTHVGHTIAQPTVQTQQTVVPYQTAAGDPQAAVGASSQNLEPNTSFPQQQQQQQQQQVGYNPWGVVPSNVQNPSGGISMQGYAAMPQPDSSWRPPVSGNQPNFPSQIPTNAPWGMNMADNVNAGWGMVQGNPNMGWGGFVPGTTNMNWGPMVNPGWVAPTGTPGAMVQTMPPGNVNPGWVAQPVNQGGPVVQGQPPGNVNVGWGPSAGPPGPNVQGPAPGNPNQGWGTPSGGNQGGNNNVQGSNSNSNPNPNSGNANQRGWNTPPGNSSGRRNENRQSGNRFSGPRGRGGPQGGRPYRPRLYDSDGNRICPYFLDGHCVKGSRCDMVHEKPPLN